MPLQTSGQISFLDLQNEFGGSNPISLDEYYRGGASGLVPGSVAAGTGSFQGAPLVSQAPVQIATSGTIQMSMFYGTADTTIFNVVISSNITTGFNLRNVLTAAPYNWDGVSPATITVTVNSSIAVIGPDTVTPAFQTRTGAQPAYPAGTTITLINNGFIVGRGGAGGAGGSATGANPASTTPGQPGGTGGTALVIREQITIFNNGTIAGGGGGGGGGAAAVGEVDAKAGQYVGIGGSGGGGGRSSGTSGSFGGAAGPNITYGYNGISGVTPSTGWGAGGGNVTQFGATNGAGGAGGDWGQPGSPGQAASGATVTSGGVGAGGAAGSAIVVITGGITWGAFGTIIGAGFSSPFTLSSSPAGSINEGSSVTVNLLTVGTAAPGLTVGWTVTGISAADLSAGNLSGAFLIPSTTSTTFTLLADTLTEGPETLTLRLTPPTGQPAGVMPSISIPINDTSVSLGSVRPSGSGTWNGFVETYGFTGASCFMTFNPNGSVTHVNTFGPIWYSPTGGSPGSAVWIRATVTGGSLNVGIANTWLSLSTGRSFGVQTPGVIGSEGVVLTFQFATDPAGSNIVATHTNCSFSAVALGDVSPV